MANATNKGLNFIVSLKDEMSKGINVIKNNYGKLKEAIKGTFDAGKRSNKEFNESLEKTNTDSKKVFEAIKSGANAIKGGFTKVIEVFSILTKQSSLLLDGMIDVNKQVQVSSMNFSELQDTAIELSSNLRSPMQDITDIFKTANITQFSSKQNLKDFTKGVQRLTETTNLSKNSAAKAFDTYQFWYKGSSSGFMNLANTIRFVTATSRLSSEEAAGSLDRFQSAALNLDKQYRGNVAKSSLAISKATANAGADLNELSGIFDSLTDTYSEQGIFLKSFLIDSTKITESELNKMISEGNFTKVFELIRESIDTGKMDKETFMLWKDNFKELTGVSFEFARALREVPLEQVSKDLKGTLEASNETKQIEDDFEKFRKTIGGLTKEMQASFEPMLASVGKEVLKFGIEVLSVVRDIIITVNQELTKMGLIFSEMINYLKPVENIKFLLDGLRIIIGDFFGMSDKAATWSNIMKAAIDVVYGAFKRLYDIIINVIDGMAKVFNESGKAEATTFNPETRFGSDIELPKNTDSRTFDEIMKDAESSGKKSYSGLSGFSKGGIIRKPTFALVGEGGEPELILPFSRINEFLSGLTENNITGRNESLTQSNLSGITREITNNNVYQNKSPNVSVNVNNNRLEAVLVSILNELRIQNHKTDESYPGFGGMNSSDYNLLSGRT